MKKRGALYLLLLLLCFGCLTGCGRKAEQREAERELGLRLPTASTAETQGERGWFGDGTILTELHFEGQDTAQVEKTLSTASGWQALPLEPEVELLLYGGEIENGTRVGVLESESIDIPRCDAGYWYYQDRTPEGGEYVSNFTAAVYDAEQGTLYLLRWDS